MSTGITLLEGNADKVAEWCGGLLVLQHDALDYEKTTPAVNVPVRVDDKHFRVERAQVGDVIVRENDGSFRIIKQHEIGG